MGADSEKSFPSVKRPSVESFKENDILTGTDSKPRNMRVMNFVFPKMQEYSHDIVQYTIRSVEKLNELFNEHFQGEEKPNEEVNNIWLLLIYFVSDSEHKLLDPRKQKMFRYFAAVTIYSQIMIKSFKNSRQYAKYKESLERRLKRRSEENIRSESHNTPDVIEASDSEDETSNDESDSLPPSEWKILNEKEIGIAYLNEIAGEVLKELSDFSCVKQEIDEKKSNDTNFVFLQKRAGNLASKECVGSTPYLIVYKGKGREVSIRRGFELYRPKHPEASMVEDINMPLKDLPVRHYHNGEYYENKSDKHVTLLSLVENRELAEKLFYEKHITEIHVKVIDGGRISYNIDIIDHKLEGDINIRASCNKRIENLTGRKLGTVKKSCSLQEDLLITFFSNIFFAKIITKSSLQAFEKWAFNEIRHFTKPSDPKDFVITNEHGQKPGMYIGFCFGTLLDVGYSNQNWVTGCRNVLLLALTRGFKKLSDNLSNEDIHWPPNFRDELEKQQSDTKPVERETEGDIMLVPAKDGPTLQNVIMKRKIVFDEGVYLGSTAKGIVVRIKRNPLRLTWIWSLVLLAIFGFPYMYWMGAYDGKDWSGILRAVGSILELWGAILALGFLAVKCVFTEWSILDMFNSRKRCESLEELIQVMKYTEERSFPKSFKDLFKRFKEEYKIDNKRKAIKLCATLPMPETIFSHYNSCAFSVDGHGEFEIDVGIDVADLTQAGYLFGVNYYGDPIVKDAKGDIRKMHFEGCKKKNRGEDCNCKNESIIIGGHHDLQTNKIFHLNTKNRIVGMHKQKNTFFLSMFRMFRKTPPVDSIV